MRIDDVHTWIRDAVSRCARLRFFIEDVVGTYDLRVRIRKQRIGDMVSVREILECPDGIIADGRNTKSLLPDGVQIPFQLNELDLAERSPVRRTEEYEHGALRAHDGFESLVAAFLVLRGKSGHLLTYTWPGLDVLAEQRRHRNRPHRHLNQ
jgi:hypothetical protein